MNYDIIKKIIKNQADTLCDKVKINDKEYYYITDKGVGIISDTYINMLTKSVKDDGDVKLKNNDITEAIESIDDICLYSGAVKAISEVEKPEIVTYKDDSDIIDISATFKKNKSLKQNAEGISKKLQKTAKSELRGATGITKEDTESAPEDSKSDGKIHQQKNTNWNYSFDVLDKYSFTHGKIIHPKDFLYDKMNKAVNWIENCEFNLYTMGPKILLMALRGVSTAVALGKGIAQLRAAAKKLKKSELSKKIDNALKEIKKAEKNNKIPE